MPSLNKSGETTTEEDTHLLNAETTHEDEPDNSAGKSCICLNVSSYYFTVLSAIFVSVLNGFVVIMVQVLNKSVGVTITTLTAQSLLFAITLPYVIYVRKTITMSGKQFLILTAASLLRSSALYMQYFSLKKISVMDSNTIAFSKPVPVAIISYLFFKISRDLYDISTIFLTFIGIILVCRPSFIFDASSLHSNNWDRAIGFSCICCSLIFCTIHSCCIFYLKCCPVSLLLMIQSLITMIIGAVDLCFRKEYHISADAHTILLLIALAFISILTFFIFTYTTKILDPLVTATIETSEIPLSFLLQVFVLDDFPYVSEMIGAVLVASATIISTCKTFILKSFRNIVEKCKCGTESGPD